MTSPFTSLSPPAIDAIAGGKPLALFLDFDGTLVELAATPDGIEVESGLFDRLHALFDRLDGKLALISGRALDNLEMHLGSMRIWRAGSHGSDCRDPAGAAMGSAAQALPPAAIAELRAYADRAGIDYEAKQHGGALHFRAHPDAEGGALAFAETLSAEHGLAVKAGKAVVEVVRPGADKGTAVRAFMARPEFAGACPVFIGDDVTDEDGFAAAQELGGHAIIVGARGDTRAEYRLPGVKEVHEWLNL
ncbi:MAG: trehalose-phosphatase [Tsuneonella suprasediminis]|nr:trehalose-phosphatase [Altererythrobacter sp. N1]